MAKFLYFRDLPGATNATPPGSARYFEGVGGNPDRVVRVGDVFVDRNAEVGDHILQQGIVPGGGRYYQVFDRKIAANEVKEFSGSGTDFGYFFKTSKDGTRSSYQFILPGKTVNLTEFLTTPPGGYGKPPKRVVLFGEPDDTPEAGATISPLWKALRTEGGGAGKPPNRRWTTAFAEPGGEESNARQRTELLRTINASRAKEKLGVLDHQDPLRFDRIQFVDDGNMENLWFTPRKGNRSQVVVFLGKNDSGFRESVRRAALEGKLRNKQIALISCGDEYAETAALRELLLREGALMVWVPDRQITPHAGLRLKTEIANTFPGSKRPGPRTIQEVIERSLSKWKSQTPDDPDLKSFEQSATWVFLVLPRTGDDC